MCKRNEPPIDVGVPPSSTGDWAFLLHMIASMSGNGRVAAVAPHGVLFRDASEGKIRQAIIDKNLIDAVIGLPEIYSMELQFQLVFLFSSVEEQQVMFFLLTHLKVSPKKKQRMFSTMKTLLKLWIPIKHL